MVLLRKSYILKQFLCRHICVCFIHKYIHVCYCWVLLYFCKSLCCLSPCLKWSWHLVLSVGFYVAVYGLEYRISVAFMQDCRPETIYDLFTHKKELYFYKYVAWLYMPHYIYLWKQVLFCMGFKLWVSKLNSVYTQYIEQVNIWVLRSKCILVVTNAHQLINIHHQSKIMIIYSFMFNLKVAVLNSDYSLQDK